MIRHSPAVPVAKSPLLTRAGPLAVLASALLVAACGDSKDTTASTSITGTFDVSSIDCNGQAAGVPASLTARLASGRNYTFAFDGAGTTMTIAIVDPTCTWGGQYRVAYLSDTRFSFTGFGSFSCTPSAAACASVLAVEEPNDPDVCGVANSESHTNDHGPVPQNAGGTMVLSLVGENRCSQNGGIDPLRFVLTRR